jgi:hypothetical protein
LTTARTGILRHLLNWAVARLPSSPPTADRLPPPTLSDCLCC